MVVVTWHCHCHHLMMVVAWPEARRHRHGLRYHGSTGSMSLLGRDGGVMLQWWYGPGHVTVIVVTSRHKQGGPRGVVVGTTRMSSSLPLSLSRCGGGTAWGTSSSQGGRSGSGRVVAMLLHEGDSGRILVTSVILLPRWDRVW